MAEGKAVNKVMEVKMRKEPDFEILKGNRYKWMFVDENASKKPDGSHYPGYISYRQVIAYALFKLLQSNGKNLQEAKEKFNAFKEVCNDWTSSKGKYEGFLEAYNFQNFDGSTGLLICDKTKGCYPLMITKDKRNNALKTALEDLEKNLDKILEKLALSSKWNQSLEDELNKIYQIKQEEEAISP